MSHGPAPHFDMLLDECMDAIGRIEARLASRLGDPVGDVEWGDVDDAARLQRALEDAAKVARTGKDSPPVADSDACPACGGTEVGMVGAVPGVALGSVEAGRFVPAGQTEIDWSGWLPQREGRGAVLCCASCTARWIHRSLFAED